MDPFLLTHNVESVLFDISSNLTPISIRDQMLRACVFVDRAVAAKLIEGRERPLLVIGAGVAGAVAATQALAHGVRTILVEKTTPFKRLASSRKRYVSATQYDWPAHHWTELSFPWRNPSMQLIWLSGHAAQVLSGWRIMLTEADRDDDEFNLLPYTFLKGIKIRSQGPEYPERQLIEAHLQPQPANIPTLFGAAVSTIGFGKENCSVGSYVGYEFWGNDAFKRKNVGVKDVAPNVLISGGGDGALQDFLRIVTHVNSAHDIYQRIPEDIQREIERDVGYAEDCAVRGYIWSGAASRDCAVLQQLHKDHLMVIDKLKKSGSWDRVKTALSPILKKIPDELTIKLAFPCDHFSSCYALNRFLTLLLAELISEMNGGSSPLLPATKIVGVTSNTHTCGEPDVCHGNPHVVTYVSVPICADFFGAESSYLNAGHTNFPQLGNDPLNVVIIRHGIFPPLPLFNRPPVSNGRQVLPYYIPW